MHMAQLMPLPLTVSCFSKIQLGFTFLVLVHPDSPGQRAVKRVCVCVRGRQPTGDVGHKPRLPILSARPLVIFPALEHRPSWLVSISTVW